MAGPKDLAWTLEKPIFLRVRQISSLVTINPFTPKSD